MAQSTSFPTTFKVAAKNPEQVRRCEEDGEPNTSVFSKLKHYGSEHCTEILMETPFPSTVQPTSENGFVHTVIDCYNHHHNLVIRPDDVWMAIVTQFSFYINKNAEEFRNKFVDFEGQKTLSVNINGTLRSAPYDLFVTKMTEKIDENLVDKTVKDWIIPNFSTTTSNDIVSCGIVFMATTKKYFKYECCLLCGIPNITLEGTVADWKSILVRLKKLKEYNLGTWYDMLKPILKEFVAAKKKKPNTKFWNRICDHYGGGSGPSYISGWLTAFAVFDEDGNWTNVSNVHPFIVRKENSKYKRWLVIEIDKIPSGIVKVDVKIVDNDDEYQSVMFAGHVGYKVLDDNCTFQPQIGWALALKSSAEEVGESS